MEIWKDVLNYEDSYEISSYGNLKSKTKNVPCKGNKTRTIKGKPRKIFPNKKGYMTCVLSKNNKLKTFTIHQLVAQAFLPNFTKGLELNHIDGDKTNNYITNLELSNPSHNQLHANKIRLKPKQGKSKYNNVTYVKNPRAKRKWAASIRHDGKSSYGWKTFYTEEEAAKYVDTLLDNINDTQRIRNFP